MSNWFGLQRGRFVGEPPAYVDKSNPPGMTDVPRPTILSWARTSPFVLITSPNFVWVWISLLVYRFAPYDLGPNSVASLAPIHPAFLSERLPLWFSLTFGYFAFWHVSLYGFQLAQRPFIEAKKRVYNWNKVVHNAFWTTSGIVLWALFENVFCYLWATDRLPYIDDFTSFHTANGIFRFLITLMGIPVWRSVHFYFAHRLLHYGPLYKQVHSLHHRNTDIEPFSGLCMHPVEHLYYFACVAPSLVFYCSPYAFVWNGVHLLLSPAASHSGYEDHFQSDLFHYLHHRYFECNYAGSDAACLDILFGTYKGSFAEHPLDKHGPEPRADAKSTLFTLPTSEFVSYLFLSIACFAIPIGGPIARAILAGFGPVGSAIVISKLFGSSRGVQPVKMTFLGNIAHITTGTLFCCVPISYLCWLLLVGKNEGMGTF